MTNKLFRQSAEEEQMKSIIFLAILCCWAATAVQGERFVCYFPNWAVSRSGLGTYDIKDIDTNLCTHLIYSFAILHPETLTITTDPTYDNEEQRYTEFTALKKPNLKTMIAIGGWADCNPDEGTQQDRDKYNRLVSSQTNIDNFVNSVLDYLNKYKFDGLDVDWEYPRNGADKVGYINLMSSLKKALEPNFLLSAALPAGRWALEDGYDLPALNKAIDFINLMSYDMHGQWEYSVADHHAPLYQRPSDMNAYGNIDFIVSYLIDTSITTPWDPTPVPAIDADKITLGIPIYGRSWELSAWGAGSTTPPCDAAGGGLPGQYTEEKGFMAYYEICLNLLNQTSPWTKQVDPTHTIGPWAYSSSDPKQWVGYDDLEMIEIKTQFIVDRGLGGAMVWDIAMDDFTNVCGDGVNPIMNAIHKSMVKP